jgi:ABC-type uncharacterized transport system fused permease/ATPase subunit
MPGTTIFSVGHRSTLRALHERHLTVQPNGKSGAVIVDLTGLAWHAS